VARIALWLGFAVAPPLASRFAVAFGYSTVG
jgi:hypothetical protein